MAVELRNPYLDAFLLYCCRAAEGGFREWEARTDWRLEDGFSGPAWDRHIQDEINVHMVRHYLCPLFAWAVPTAEAVCAIAELSPIVEIGAGTGYWAWLLAQAGAQVDAFDLRPGVDEANQWTGEAHWTEVRKGDPSVLPSSDAPTLLLCWPPYSNTMALDSLQAFRGDTLVYVGEHEGGCCATDEFFAALEAAWESVREIGLPQWPGLHDYVSIWRRTPKVRVGGRFRRQP